MSSTDVDLKSKVAFLENCSGMFRIAAIDTLIGGVFDQPNTAGHQTSGLLPRLPIDVTRIESIMDIDLGPMQTAPRREPSYNNNVNWLVSFSFGMETFKRSTMDDYMICSEGQSEVDVVERARQRNNLLQLRKSVWAERLFAPEFRETPARAVSTSSKPRQLEESFNGSVLRIDEEGGLAFVSLADSDENEVSASIELENLPSPIVVGTDFMCNAWKTSNGIEFEYIIKESEPPSKEKIAKLRAEIEEDFSGL